MVVPQKINQEKFYKKKLPKFYKLKKSLEGPKALNQLVMEIGKKKELLLIFDLSI